MLAERVAGRRCGERSLQISTSILSADLTRLGDEIEQISGIADWAHVDVTDNHFVPTITFGLPMVEALARRVAVPLDCHLGIEAPDRWAAYYAEAGAGSVTIHAEATKTPVRTCARSGPPGLAQPSR